MNEMKQESNFGELLSDWRTFHNLTTREASLILGCTASAITRWERNERTPHPMMMRGVIQAMTNHSTRHYHALCQMLKDFDKRAQVLKNLTI